MSWRPTPHQVLAGVLAALILVAPTIPNHLWRGDLGISPEAGILLGLLFVLGAVPGRSGAAAPGRRYLGTWRAWVIGAAWATLAGFEIALQVARYATNENLPLYDAALLSRHLYILGRDLYGFGARLVLAAVVVSPLALWLIGTAMFGRIEAQFELLGRRRAGIAASVLVVVGLLGVVLPGGRWATPRIVRNVTQSWTLYSQIATEIAHRSHAGLEDLEFGDPPDVFIYVVESYGRVVEQDPTLVERWSAGVGVIDTELQSAGWSTASAFGVAPVKGGRSWISDAAVLFGLRLSHQSEFEHAMALVGRLPNLRRAFDERGYATVLVKPADRERPGVALDNSFAFEHTVFADDLEYEGPIVGWGRIPDQYTIGYVHDRVLPELEPPVFAFFHLATSHMPWPGSPRLMDRWEQWNGAPGAQRPVFGTRTTESEVAMRVSRFKRRTREGLGKDPTPGQHQRYLDTVLFDLQAIARQQLAGAERRTLIVIYGDHQPPIVANEDDPDVPIHLVASDPALLEPFLGHGFVPGFRPRGEATVLHEDLFPILIEGIASAAPSDGQGTTPRDTGSAPAAAP
jgi:hypothetical protein